MDFGNPYRDMPANRFWRSAIADRDFLGVDKMWTPAFDIRPEDTVITAGSCFAQHIGRALAKNGYGWTDFEPAPPMLPDEAAKAFNFGIFSFRTGNIYTTPQLAQWVNWALKRADPPKEVWEEDGRFFDPFRPQIEPNGFGSADEMFAARNNTLAALKRAIHTSDIFVFTLGLTEMWENTETGLAYAMCPGTAAGVFDPEIHKFKNLTYPEIYSGMRDVINLVKRVNPKIKFLLTVSPVPLTATASPDHVLVANTYSKSVLRSVAGDLANAYDFVDYFPSFEIISSVPNRAMFYEPNMRSVRREGVDFVMSHFFKGLGVEQKEAARPTGLTREILAAERNEDDIVCEEEILEANNAN